MSGDLHIRPVTTRADLRHFVDLAEQLYRNDPHWIPALRSAQLKLFRRQTAFFQHAEMELYLATRGTQPVARVAAICNRAHLEQYHDGVGFFGFFECASGDAGAARGLFEHAQNWLRQRGMTAMRGPVNPSMNGECGLLIEGFDRPPMALMTYNPPSYAELLESLGLRKCKDLYAYLINVAALGAGSDAGKRLLRLGEVLRRRHPEVTIRILDMRRYEEDVLRCMAVFETARSRNWGYVPVTQAEIRQTARDLRQIVDPEMVLLAEVDGRPAGALLGIPNINGPLKAIGGRLFPFGFIRFFRELKKVRELRVLGVAALKEDRAKGITALLLVDAMIRALKRGYHLAEASWVLEDNQMSNTTIGSLEPKLYKKYRLYEMPIAPKY